MIANDKFEMLSKYERIFATAVKAHWASYPGRAAIDEMVNYWNEQHKCNRRVAAWCGHCVLSLITDCGKDYFAEVERRARVVAVAEDAPAPQKVAIKTKKNKK